MAEKRITSGKQVYFYSSTGECQNKTLGYIDLFSLIGRENLKRVVRPKSVSYNANDEEISEDVFSISTFPHYRYSETPVFELSDEQETPAYNRVVFNGTYDWATAPISEPLYFSQCSLASLYSNGFTWTIPKLNNLKIQVTERISPNLSSTQYTGSDLIETVSFSINFDVEVSELSVLAHPSKGLSSTVDRFTFEEQTKYDGDIISAESVRAEVFSYMSENAANNISRNHVCGIGFTLSDVDDYYKTFIDTTPIVGEGLYYEYDFGDTLFTEEEQKWLIENTNLTEEDFEEIIVTFSGNGGLVEGSSAVQRKVNTQTFKVSPPSYVVHSNPNKTFKWWSFYAIGGRPIDFNTQEFHDSVTVYAIWETKEVQVTFDCNGGHFASGGDREVIYVGEDGKVSPPNNPIHDDPTRSFLGWSRSANSRDTIDFSTETFTRDTTVYAVWDIREVFVTFNANGGSFFVGDTVRQKADDDTHLVVPPPNPTHPNSIKEFLYWSFSTEDAKSIDFTSTPFYNDATVYAIWSTRTVEVTFDANGGQFNDGEKKKSVKPNENSHFLIFSETPTKDNAVFLGWGETTTSSKIIDVDSTQFYYSTTLFAIWAAKGKPIIIPSKSIYTIDDQKVIDNEVDRLEVGENVVFSNNKENTQIYSISISDLNPDYYSGQAFNNDDWWTEGRDIAIAGCIADIQYYTIPEIKIPRRIDTTNIIQSILLGENESGYYNIGVRLYGRIDKGVASAIVNLTIIGGRQSYSINYNSISLNTPPTSTTTGDFSIPKQYSYTYSDEESGRYSIDISVDIGQGTLGTQTATLDDDYIYLRNLQIPIQAQLVDLGLSAEKSSDLEAGARYMSGEYTTYTPTLIELTFNGDTIGIQLEENTIQIGSGEHVYSFTANELMQSSNNPSVRETYQEIIDEWGKGKEVAVLKCALSDYRDEDNNIAVSPIIDNMTFHGGDIVIPYVYGANGKDKPMSFYPDGTPKMFNVIGKKIICRGSVYQEITIQEIPKLS